MKHLRPCIPALMVLLSLAAMVIAQTNATEELDRGIEAYKQAKYELAVSHFRNAAVLEPQNEEAHLYLATALAQQYIPGVDSLENKRMGEAAISEYEKALQINPQSERSLKSIASVYMEMKRFEDAKSHYRKVIDMDPNAPEPYYSIGVIDWTMAYSPRMKVREKLGVKPDEQLPVNFSACWELRDKNQAPVEEGMQMLTNAIELRHDYDDAMAYMNLLYRERAEIQCNNPEGRTADLETADHWIDLTMAAKKRKTERSKSGNVNSTGPQ